MSLISSSLLDLWHHLHNRLTRCLVGLQRVHLYATSPVLFSRPASLLNKVVSVGKG